MPLSLSDFIGIVGVLIIIIAYMLLQLEKMDSQDIRFSSLNALGAFLIILSLLYDWNLASFLMESTWMMLSIYGMFKYYRQKKGEKKMPPEKTAKRNLE